MPSTGTTSSSRPFRLAALVVAALLGARVLGRLGRQGPARAVDPVVAPEPVSPTPRQEPVSPTLRQAPEEVIRKWLDQHGPVSVGLGAIAQTWSLERLADGDPSAIAAALARAGVEVSPPLEEASVGDLIALRVASVPPASPPVEPAEVQEPSEVEQPESLAVQETEPKAPRIGGQRQAVAFAVTALRWTVLGLAVGLIGALRAAKLAGLETMTVMSGSMEPAIHHYIAWDERAGGMDTAPTSATA